MKHLTVVFFCLVLLLFSCEPSSISSGTGTGSDLGEGKVLCMVSLPNGEPAANASVTYRDQLYVPFSVEPQLHKLVFTDSAGSIKIDTLPPGYYVFEIQTQDSLFAMKRVYIPDSEGAIDLGTITLDQQVVFKGTVRYNGVNVARAQVLVLGLDRQVITGNDGTFSMTLPTGEYLFKVIALKENVSGEFIVSDKKPDDTLLLSPNPVTVLEDFDSIDDFNSLNKTFGGGKWFSYTDDISGGHSLFEPSIDNGVKGALEIKGITDEPDSYSGGSFHVQYLIDTVYNPHFAIVGTYFHDAYDSTSDTGTYWFDITKMTALTFVAKGSGTVYVQFRCQYVESLKKSYLFDVEIPVELHSSWTKTTIVTKDIPSTVVPNASLSLSWKAAALSVNSIGFLAREKAELYLDDVIIEGMAVTDFKVEK